MTAGSMCIRRAIVRIVLPASWSSTMLATFAGSSRTGRLASSCIRASSCARSAGLGVGLAGILVSATLAMCSSGACLAGRRRSPMRICFVARRYDQLDELETGHLAVDDCIERRVGGGWLCLAWLERHVADDAGAVVTSGVPVPRAHAWSGGYFLSVHRNVHWSLCGARSFAPARFACPRLVCHGL